MKIYKFGLTAIVAIALICASTHSFATLLSSWNFEVNTPPDLNNSVVGPVVLNEGGLYPGSLNGVHASTATDWSTPAGNGSANSYSVNTWAVNDYYQISTSSLNYADLTLTFDTTGSGTGPRDFKVQSSTDGTTYTDLPFDYSVLLNGGAPNSSWSATGPVQAAYTITTPLPISLENQAAIFLRLVNRNTTSIAGGTTAAGGTNRVDNVLVEGILIPEPTTFALMLASLGGLLIRRK